MIRGSLRGALLLAALGVTHAPPVHAQQGQDAMIVGEVHDGSGGAIGNATISISSANLIGGVRNVTTRRTGSYRAPALAPGLYELTAAAPGFRSQLRHALALLPGATATIDFVLAPAALQETVTVTANEPSALDVRTSAASTVIGHSVLDNLPLNRTVSDYVNLVPGVVGFADIGVVAFGSSVGANPLTLDGTSGNEPGWGTPCIACPLPLGAVPSASWIEELQVVSLGADALYGEYTGAPITAITRSGSNRFAGQGDFWTTRSGWVADNRGSLTPALAARFVPLDILDRWSAVGRLGGPIRLDKAWFFGGVDLYRNVNRPAGFAAIANPPEDAILSLNEPKAFGKITGAFHQSVRLETYIARDLSTRVGDNASPSVTAEALTADHRQETLWSGRMTWAIDDHTLVEAHSGVHAAHDTNGPREAGGIAGPPGHFDSSTGLRSANATSYSDASSRVVNGSIAVSRFVPAGSGPGHQLKAGFEFEHDRLRTESGFPGGMAFFDVNGLPDTVSISAPTIYRPNHRRQTLYIQDGWSPVGRLTVNAGVRAGFYQGAIADGPTQFSAHALAPRIGVAWDVRAEHTLAIRGHFGRYHEPMVTSFYDFLDPLSQPTEITAQVVGPNQFAEVSRFDSNNRYSVDPATRYPYADEWIAAIDRLLPHHVSITAQYIGRRYGSIVGFVGLMNWTPVQRQDPGKDGRVGTSDDGSLVTIYLNPASDGWRAYLTNPDGAYKRYEGVQLIATRRGGPWEGQASYTWSRTRASFDNQFSSNAGNNDLSTNGAYVNPNRAHFSDSRPSADFTHELKAVATAALPWPRGVRASGIYRYQTGVPWGRRVIFQGAVQFNPIYVEPRGTDVAPSPSVLDLRIEKSFAAARSAIGVYADIFNVTNQGVGNRFVATSGANFGTPASWSNPRIIRAGFRVTF